MLARPFVVECRSALLPGPGHLQVLVRLAPGVELDPQRLEALRRPLRALAKMGEWGGMAGDACPPLQSTMSLRTDGVPFGARDLRWDFDVVGIHIGVTCVIVNLVHGFHLEVAPVDSVVLRWGALRDGSSVADEPPYDFEPYPFLVELGYETPQVLVDVDFRARMAPDAAEPFREAWEAWYTVAAAGGFCTETVPPQSNAIFIEDDLQVTSTGIGGAFDGVLMDDTGWHCLINMLQMLHHRLAPIEQVTIE
jgi:hypothetical protein